MQFLIELTKTNQIKLEALIELLLLEQITISEWRDNDYMQNKLDNWIEHGLLSILDS